MSVKIPTRLPGNRLATNSRFIKAMSPGMRGDPDRNFMLLIIVAAVLFAILVGLFAIDLIF